MIFKRKVYFAYVFGRRNLVSLHLYTYCESRRHFLHNPLSKANFDADNQGDIEFPSCSTFAIIAAIIVQIVKNHRKMWYFSHPHAGSFYSSKRNYRSAVLDVFYMLRALADLDNDNLSISKEMNYRAEKCDPWRQSSYLHGSPF